MRALLLALMIALLPLRGWSAAVMTAAPMGHAPSAAASQGAMPACHEAPAHGAARDADARHVGPHADPHAAAPVTQGHAVGHTDATPQAAAAGGEHDCTHCVICHSAALPAAAVVAPSASAAHAAPGTAAPPRKGVAPRRLIKPPIA